MMPTGHVGTGAELCQDTQRAGMGALIFCSVIMNT